MMFHRQQQPQPTRTHDFHAMKLVVLCITTLLMALQVKQSYGQTTSTCVSSINEIEVAESQVTDYSTTVRTYILCSQTTFTIAKLDYYNTIQFDTGSNMIHLRPNLHIKCGDDGLRSNNCIISGGTIQVDGTSFFTTTSSSTTNGTTTTTTSSASSPAALTNVVLTGLTFTNVEKHHVWIDRPGTVLFNDCSFKDNTDAVLPILLDYFDPSTTTTTELIVTIEQCDFSNNIYYGIPSLPSLIVSNSKQNRLLITDTNFTGNDMIFNNTNYERASFLIESSGPIELQRNCFQHNALGVAPVAVYGAAIVSSDNYLYNSTGATCQLSAYFTAASYATFTPICATYDSPQCIAVPVGSTPVNTTTAAPIPTPTTAPVVSTNTSSPSIKPTFFPAPTTTNDTAPSLAPIPTSTNSTTPTPPILAPTPSGMVFWTPPPSPTTNGTDTLPINNTTSSSVSLLSSLQLAVPLVVTAIFCTANL